MLRHRFADVRFAQHLRNENAPAVSLLTADDLMSLDASGGGGRDPRHADGSAWAIENWLYFYRNTRQLSAVTWLGDLDDLRAVNEKSAARLTARATGERAARGAAGAVAQTPQYERASTGRASAPPDDDRAAARALLGRMGLGAAPSREEREREESGLAEEIGRMRHHAEVRRRTLLSFAWCGGVRLTTASAASRAARLHDDPPLLERRGAQRGDLRASEATGGRGRA